MLGRAIALLLLCSVGLAVWACATLASPAGVGKIAYIKNGEIYVIKGDGSGERRLTHASKRVDTFAWSPDGRMIAFADQAGNVIHLIDADGMPLRRITVERYARGLTWSPDSRRLAFHAGKGPTVFVVNVNFGGSRRLLPGSYLGGTTLYPSWSPHGATIAISAIDRVQGRLTGIYTVRADGSQVQSITRGPDTFESWSPDGRSILFTRLRPKLDPNHRLGNDIRVVHLNSTRGNRVLFRATPPGSAGWCPSWSPDGKRILFERARYLNFGRSFTRHDVMVMDADGSHLRNLTRGMSGNAYPGWPAWSPDGRRIAFTVGPNFGDLHVMNSDGSDEHRLVAAISKWGRSAHTPRPAWQPSPGSRLDDGCFS